MTWQDVQIRRGVRQRTASHEPPHVLSLLGKEDKDLLATWVRKDNVSRNREALLRDAGTSNIERAEALSDWLLREGWITRKEKLQGGTWQWDGLTWRNLDLLKSLLGVGSRTQRDDERTQHIEQAYAWFDTCKKEMGDDLRETVLLAIQQLESETAHRVGVLANRLSLLVSLVNWRCEQMNGTRRDFALYAGEHTKSIVASDWKWLEKLFDLESFGVSQFLPMVWLAGDVRLTLTNRVLDLASARCLAIPIDDLLKTTAVSADLDHWWLIENRASFERQAGQCPRGAFMAWLPGRPSKSWLKAIESLLRIAPAPLRVSADADPAGVDIARTVGELWTAQGLKWEPYRMGVDEWKSVTQKWPLNEHDLALLKRLMNDGDLPGPMQELCAAMLNEGRKAEQEGWL